MTTFRLSPCQARMARSHISRLAIPSGDFDTTGFRMPMMVISPFTKPAICFA